MKYVLVGVTNLKKRHWLQNKDNNLVTPIADVLETVWLSLGFIWCYRLNMGHINCIYRSLVLQWVLLSGAAGSFGGKQMRERGGEGEDGKGKTHKERIRIQGGNWEGDEREWETVEGGEDEKQTMMKEWWRFRDKMKNEFTMTYIDVQSMKQTISKGIYAGMCLTVSPIATFSLWLKFLLIISHLG